MCEVYSKELGQKIRVFNTHFDHVCGPARSLGVRTILEYMHRYNLREKLPTILMGDLNARPGSKPVRMLSENRHPFTDIHLTSVYSRFDTKDIHNSYHGFRGRCKGRRPIDYIFVSDDFQIQDAYLDTSSLDGRYPSDHFPLVGCSERPEKKRRNKRHKAGAANAPAFPLCAMCCIPPVRFYRYCHSSSWGAAMTELLQNSPCCLA